MKTLLQDVEHKIDADICKLAYNMASSIDSYAERLADAMHEAGFGGMGGQSALAKAVGCRSQTINQALNGGVTLGANYHIRVCMRLGVRALWLVDGRGLRYDPAGPRAALPGAEPPFSVPPLWLEGFKAEQGDQPQITEMKHADLNLAEQAFINKMRSNSRLAAALFTLAEMVNTNGE